VLTLFLLYVALCAGLLVAGVRERRHHTARLASVPHRVLVNGTRGKSSVTRLIAGGLRGGGLVTVGKTTGSAARFLFPDGTEEPIHRRHGVANVIEQVRVVAHAAAFGPDALVVECMAVQPELQQLSQDVLIRSTLGVLTNAREDHLDEMGPGIDDVARSLARTMPVGGVCVTAEREQLAVLREEAARRGCRLVEATPGDVSDAEMARFSAATFRDNVAVALAVTALLGVPREQALAGMWAAAPDPGALTVTEHLYGEASVRVANLFAANDPESTLQGIAVLREQQLIADPLHLIINCRPDRLERNGQMGELVATVAPERTVLIGHPVRSALAAVAAPHRARVTALEGAVPGPELVAQLLGPLRGPTSLVLVGNIHGQGEVLLDALSAAPHLVADRSMG
jgi:poly-gamma-glutamate synthase PgsB/CapB